MSNKCQFVEAGGKEVHGKETTYLLSVLSNVIMLKKLLSSVLSVFHDSYGLSAPILLQLSS